MMSTKLKNLCKFAIPIIYIGKNLSAMEYILFVRPLLRTQAYNLLIYNGYLILLGATRSTKDIVQRLDKTLLQIL